MCWNDVLFDENKIEWAKKINQRASRFYFVHSYYYTHNTDEYIIGTTNYGYNFASAIKMDNVFGFQFHPEKSHKYGKKLLDEILKCQN
jgi:glutamine amidotransferase